MKFSSLTIIVVGLISRFFLSEGKEKIGIEATFSQELGKEPF